MAQPALPARRRLHAVPSGLLAQYGDTRFAVVFYAVSVALAGLALSAIWGYATWGHRLVPADLRPAFVGANAARLLATSGVFLASGGPALVRPHAAEYLWLLVLLNRPLVRRLDA